MHKRYIVHIFLVFVCGLVYSQDFSITGKLKDRVSQEPLESSTVYVESIKDSTLIAYTISDSNGMFQLDFSTNRKNINLFITYIGYKTIVKEISLKTPNIEMGDINLEIQANQLDEIKVFGDRIPIIVKKDTLEFNADSFQTRPDANLEELLKRLPGIEIDKKGGITMNGQVVSQILINGMPFFGNDLKIATKNIPREIVDKVELTSTKTEKERFTGKEGSSDKQTINVTIKKDKNKGHMMRATAGYGTDDRYQFNAIGNYFNGKERISLLLGKNNINNPGFSFDEVYDMIGNKRELNRNNNDGFNLGDIAFGSGEGIAESTNLGANYTNEFNNNTKVSTDYFFGSANTNNETKIFQENQLQNDLFFTDKASGYLSETDSHRFTGLFSTNIDSSLRLSFQPKFTYNKTMNSSFSNESSFSLGNEITSESVLVDSSSISTKNFNNNIEIIKRYGNQGRFLSFNLRNSYIENDGKSRYSSELSTSSDNIEIKQLEESYGKNESYNFGISYRLPLGKKKLFLDFDFNYLISRQKNNRVVNDFNDTTNEFEDLNQDLSSYFSYNADVVQPKVGLTYEGDKYSFNINGSYINVQLSNNDSIQKLEYSKINGRTYFGGFFRYQINKRSKIFLDYRVDNTIPSLNELQPIEDVKNPLNVSGGNNELSSFYNHVIRLNYTGYNSKSKTNFFLFAQSEISDDKIVEKLDVDNNLIRNRGFVNMDGNINTFGGFGINKRIKKDSTHILNISTGGGFVFRNDVTLNNDIEFKTSTFRFVPRLGLQYSYKDFFDVSPSYRLTYNTTTYNDRQKTNFTLHSLELRVTSYWPKGVVIGNDLSYVYNGSIQGNIEKTSLLWNLSFGMNMFKGNGNLKFTVYDLLRQNNNISRTVTQNFIENRESLILQRYFMLSFTYKINNFDKRR